MYPILLALLLLAPIPFPRARPVRELSASDLAGEWQCLWGGIACTMTFARGGEYTCTWPGANYTGSWGVKDRHLWLTESCDVSNPFGWVSYAILLGATTHQGPVTQGAVGVHVRLTRTPAKKKSPLPRTGR